ncbi:hypothetical protein D3C80_1176740 [compost metagenome]
MDHLRRAIGVYGQVVPGRHDLGVIGFAWVVAGADIGIGAGEDQQGFATLCQVLPLAVGPCQVRIDGAKLAFARVDQYRQVCGQQALLPLADQHGQAGVEHVLVQAAEVVLLVGFAVVHARFPCAMVPS